MRGTVLLIGSEDSRCVHEEHFRATGLIVFEAASAEDAMRQIDRVLPDVVVSVLGSSHDVSVIRDLRSRVDDATSIIVVCSLEDGDQAREAGADSCLSNAALPNEVLYEVHRALILRRSDRRL
jgi:DNA-binding response OmpR family regulator